MNGTLEHVVKQSVIYGYMLSQPFSVYVDAYPTQDNKILVEAEQIEYGTHGNVVRVLQKKLTTLSYYDDDIDGHYGIYTEQAVKKVQKIHDIHVTGQTDIYTIKHMIDEEYDLHIKQLESLSESITPNQHGKDVKIVQEALQYLGYYEGEIDGINGPLTKKSLQVAEEKHDIELSKDIRKEVLTELLEIEQFESADHIKQSYVGDGHIKTLKRHVPDIYPGMKDEKVKDVQEALEFFGLYDDAIDGHLGPLTKESIQLAEKDLRLNLTLAHEDPNSQTVGAQPELTQENEKPTNDHDAEDKALEQVKHLETKQSHDTNVIDAARSVIGTPYVWGGTSRGGFDCSGFVQFAFQSADVTIPRTVSDIWNYGEPVSEPSVGDLVFFETYKPGPSHMGIYLGNDQFIHAGESNGVQIADLNGSYWQQRYLGAKRIQ